MHGLMNGGDNGLVVMGIYANTHITGRPHLIGIKRDVNGIFMGYDKCVMVKLHHIYIL